MSKRICPECGKPMPAGSPSGKCPTCLLSLALAPEAALGEDALTAPLTGAPGDRIGHYKLLEEIGEGGFGTVWMAEQERPVRRRVALKILKLGMDTREAVARFEAERQALAMMDHPNIARVFDGGTTDHGRPFFVMELVRGIPITEFCDAQRLTTRERLELFILVCEAVQHAHQKGVIHRDLKPNNILVNEQDGRPVPKIIDFGVAKAVEEPLTDKTLFTRFHQFLGTPAYMSPEQAGLGSLDIDTRTDIYSLGVLLYELLTGQTPHDSKRLREAGYEAMLKTIREIEPPKPSTRLSSLKLENLTAIAGLRRENPQRLHKGVRGDLDWIALKALEKDRTRRYDSANGLAADLRRYLDNEPIGARPPSNLYRFQKLARRNKLLFGAVSGVVAALVVGIIIASWQAARANLNAAATRRELYVARIRLAHQAWQDGNLEQAEKMLEATTPAAGEEDLRDFEWRYLRKLCQDESRITFTNANLRFTGLAPGRPSVLAVDGQTLIFAGGNIIKWLDLRNGRELHAMTVGTNAIGSWSMAEDQPGMIACYTNGIKTLSSMGKLVPGAASLHDSCRATALSWDGAMIATGASGGSNDVKLWDVKTGSRVGPDLHLGEGVAGLAFSPDAKYLVCGTVESKFHVFDATTFKEVNVLSNHTANVHRLAFNRTGTRLASGSTDSHIRVWSFPECNEIAHLTGHQGLVGDIAFSPDSQWLASGGTDHTVRLWNMARPENATLLRGHRGNVTSVLFSRDGKELYTACDDGTVKVWQVPSTESTNVLRHAQWLNGTAFSPKGTLLAVEDQHARTTVLWDLPGRQRITNLVQHGANFDVGRVSFSPDGELLATAGQDAIAQVWNLSERKMIFEFPKPSNWVSLAFHPSKPILASGFRELRFWDLASGKQMNLLENFPGETARQVAFSPGSEQIALGLSRGNVSIWSLETKRESHSFVNNLDRIDGSLNTLCYSRDGAWLASGHVDGRIALYDMRRLQRVTLFRGHLMHITGLIFDPDDKTLVSTSWDGTVKFWYVANQQLALTLSHDGGPVNSVSFSPDGNLMATSGADGTVRLWPAVSWAEIGAKKP